MPQPERVFIDWSEPTISAVARWMRPRASHALVIVPTQQAGRRLGQAMRETPPLAVMTPAQFLEPGGDDLADPLQAALAMADELSRTRAARYPTLFPTGVPARNFAERLALAQSLRSLQAELSEHGFSIGDAAKRFPPASFEAARWSDLARLFASAEDALAKIGLRDRESARLSKVDAPGLPPEINEVVIAGVADLQPAVARALENANVAVTILIPAPPDPAAFDAWGRPLADPWCRRDPGWEDFEAQIRLVSRPDNLELDLGNADGIEIGLLDREMFPALAESVTAAGRTLHDPSGLPLSTHWLARTLKNFFDLVADPAFTSLVDLLRNGAVRAWLAGRIPELDLESALAAADKIRAAHFPATLRAAQPWIRRQKPLQSALEPIEMALADLNARPLETAERLAAEIATAFTPELDASEAAFLATAQASLAIVFERIHTAGRHTQLSAPDWFHALREAMASVRLYPPRQPDAVEAAGWLELPWSDSPHILLAGMNLGKAPAPLGLELFLAKSARATLGLPGSDERRARDAYFLARILALRSRRVDVLVLQMDAAGSPLEPSPLLFAGAGEALPDRVESLFADAPPSKPDPAWAAGWLLDPPVLEMKRSVAVTDFQRYLDCPFTFYLSRVAKMETFEPATDELDAAQFGHLVHTALEGWALDGAVKDSTDAGEIIRALDFHTSAWVEQHLGRQLSLPLRVQIESSRARLAAFANWQAEDRRKGWRIRAIEQSFEQILGRPWEVDGWKISGRVDRIDENENDGRWRVIDYKTFDASDGPRKKHLRAFRSADRTWPPDYARVEDSGDWWINLQLPLYLQLLLESGREFGTTSCGYFNLPKTIAETSLQTWDELDESLLESAMACARGVICDLGKRRFWPPNSRAAYSDFAEFFPPDATRVVDPDGAFIRSCAP